MLISLSSARPNSPASAYIPICRVHYHFVFVFSLFTVRNGAAPHSNSTRPGGSLGATVQIRARLATACNSLKFNVIFRSPMGTPFACHTAVTNRCNLFIMSPCCVLVRGRFCSDGGWLWRTAAAAPVMEVRRGFDRGSVLESLGPAAEAPPSQKESQPTRQQPLPPKVASHCEKCCTNVTRVWENNSNFPTNLKGLDNWNFTFRKYR